MILHMKLLLRLITVIFVLFGFVAPASASPVQIPVTKAILNDSVSLVSVESDHALSSFIYSIYNSNVYSLRGLYVQDVFELPIVQQPASNPGFVSTADGTLTQFGVASNYGSIGLLAHNNLAGREFFNIDTDDTLVLVYGDGHLESYDVTEIREYQALSPYSPYSSFVNLANPGYTITYEDLFYDTYGIGGRVVLQTCIEQNGIDSWGRLFIIAEKLDS